MAAKPLAARPAARRAGSRPGSSGAARPSAAASACRRPAARGRASRCRGSRRRTRPAIGRPASAAASIQAKKPRAAASPAPPPGWSRSGWPPTRTRGLAPRPRGSDEPEAQLGAGEVHVGERDAEARQIGGMAKRARPLHRRLVDDDLVDRARAPLGRDLGVELRPARATRVSSRQTSRERVTWLAVLGHRLVDRRAIGNDEQRPGDGLRPAPAFGDARLRVLRLLLPVVDQQPDGEEREGKQESRSGWRGRASRPGERSADNTGMAYSRLPVLDSSYVMHGSSSTRLRRTAVALPLLRAQREGGYRYNSRPCSSIIASRPAAMKMPASRRQPAMHSACGRSEAPQSSRLLKAVRQARNCGAVHRLAMAGDQGGEGRGRRSRRARGASLPGRRCP